MFTTLTPVLLDATASGTAQQVTYVAAPIWDIGANFKNEGLKFAVFILMGATGLLATFHFFVGGNKTAALKTVAIGVVLMGIVASLPSLGVISKDTVGGLTNSGTR